MGESMPEGVGACRVRWIAADSCALISGAGAVMSTIVTGRQEGASRA